MQIFDIGSCDILAVFANPSLFSRLLRLISSQNVNAPLKCLGIVLNAHTYVSVDHNGLRERHLFELNRSKYIVYVGKVTTKVTQRQQIRKYCYNAHTKKKSFIADSESAFILKAFRSANIDLTPCLQPHEVTYSDLFKSDLVTVEEMEVA